MRELGSSYERSTLDLACGSGAMRGSARLRCLAVSGARIRDASSESIKAVGKHAHVRGMESAPRANGYTQAPSKFYRAARAKRGRRTEEAARRHMLGSR